MLIIQEPNKVAVWNKRHFEERKTEIMQHDLKYSVRTFVDKYLKCSIWRLAVRYDIYIYIYMTLGGKGLILGCPSQATILLWTHFKGVQLSLRNTWKPSSQCWRGQVGPRASVGHFGEEENLFSSLKTEPQLFRCPATSLITLPIMLSSLHQMLDLI
jgi:hypothetical protein